MTSTGADGPLPAEPTISPMKPAADTSPFSEVELRQAAGAAISVVGASMSEPSPTIQRQAAPARSVVRKTRKTYKFANKGIIAPKSLFILSEKISMYPNMPETMVLKGNITQVPRKEQVDYVIHWPTT